MSDIDQTILHHHRQRDPACDQTLISPHPAGNRSTVSRELPPQVPDSRFIDLGLLGQGGICQVNRVKDNFLHRQTALKYLKPEFLNHPEARLRFEFEAQVSAQLEHPNIIPVHEYYTDQNNCSINMKLVEGSTLEEYITHFGVDRLDHLDHILGICMKVLDALRFAHSRGIIHRDIKPSNIMIGQFGEVYTMDWGIVKQFRKEPQASDIKLQESLSSLNQFENGIIGTPAYMSPEQANGWTDRMDERSDIFSVGALLYFCVAGHAPYPQEDTLGHAQRCDILPIEQNQYVPAGLIAIIKKAMAADPENRYFTIADMARAIDELIHGKPLTTYYFQQGEKITEIGEMIGTAYFILEGLCLRYELDEHGNRINEVALEKGQCFDVPALLSERKRTATVEAITDVTVQEIVSDSIASGLGLNAWYGTVFQELANQYLALEKHNQELQARLNALQK